MKARSILVLASALALCFTACHWFQADEPNRSATPSFLGHWRLDSLQPGSDSSLAFAFVGMALQSQPVDVEFRTDTLFTQVGSVIDTVRYQYLANTRQLLLADSASKQFRVSLSGDSLLQLEGEKNLRYVFRKK